MQINRYIMPILVLIWGVTGCALYPSEAEQGVRLSKENFSSNYRVAVTSYQREADIDTAFMQTTIWTMLRQGSVNEALSDITKLEKLDEVMQAALSQMLPSNAEILKRSDYGAASPILGGEIVADDAMRIATDEGYDALLFVAVQPVLTTRGTTGLESFWIELLGLTQLHKVLPSGEVGGSTALLHSQDTVLCEQPSEGITPILLRLAIDGCVSKLAIKIRNYLKVRLGS